MTLKDKVTSTGVAHVKSQSTKAANQGGGGGNVNRRSASGKNTHAVKHANGPLVSEKAGVNTTDTATM